MKTNDSMEALGGYWKQVLPFIWLMLFVWSEGKAQTYEAESGILSGTQQSAQRAGFSGAGYVTGFDADGDKVTLTVTAERGVYELYVRYASPSGDKFNFILLNGDNLGSVAFPLSTTFKEVSVGKVYLNHGENTIAILKDWGWFDVDNIRLEGSAAPDIITNLSPDLVTPEPSAKADSLYDLFTRIYGKVVISGQYGGDTELSYIRNISGRTPVVRGFDMMDYSPSRVERGATSTEIAKAIEWSQQRGIVTFCWHWNAPKDLIDEPGREWWRGFYTEATTFDIAKAMNDHNSEEYSLVIRDIDAIAEQLKTLSVNNVPVLWRPLHEAEGKWFWWGAKGPEPTTWLWKLLFERLVNHHQLDNLIWVWTSTGNPEAPEWYPGDDYVDMIGADVYLPAGTYSSNLITFNNMAEHYGGKKIIALSENGTVPDPEKLFFEGAAWSWFATWSGSFITDGDMNSAQHVEKVFNHDYVITLDEIDDMKSIIAMLEEKRSNDAEPPPITNTETEMKTPALLFQNPVQNDRLILKTGGRAKVLIYNLQGQIQFPEMSTSGGHYLEFDFRGKPAGLYIMKVLNRRSVETYRVMKAE